MKRLNKVIGFANVVFLSLCVVGLVGLLYLALPCGVDRGRQKRTIAGMLQLKDELSSYREQHGRYPGRLEAVCGHAGSSVECKDAWGRRFRFELVDTGYLLASRGKDGKSDFDATLEKWPNRTWEYTSDIVLTNGQFIQFPEGLPPERR